ncbi:MAG: ATP-binding protein [Muribaculaceae bacterium]|nr:ATP-binding protein [Muribaculaceae bacterium]
MKCRVRGFDDEGTPVLGHIIENYVEELYSEADRTGEIFDFTVLVPSQDGEEYMTVGDEYGLRYRLKKTEGVQFHKGQRVKGSFYRARNGKLNLKYVREQTDYPFYTFEEVCDGLGLSARERIYYRRLLYSRPELKTVQDEIDGDYTSWPLTALTLTNKLMPEWFMQARTDRGKKILERVVGVVRALGLFLLERSAFLNLLSDDERQQKQDMLTTIVENIKPYALTLELVREGRHEEFISSLLGRLQKSGFIYHPSRQFAILMLIFRLFPHEVQTNLDRIFALIFERKLSNWQREPFRQAFVEQFDIYINLAREAIENLPQVESPEERARIGNLLTAIALELLIAGQDGLPEEYAPRLRSLFYRYASLVSKKDSDVLLNKSFLALTNNDHFPPAYTFDNLKHPMVMLARASRDVEKEDAKVAGQIAQTYSNGHVQLTVNSKGLRLQRAGRGDCDLEAIPDGWMPWLNPQISLEGLSAPGRAAISKLKERSAWWAEAERTLFDRLEKPAATVESKERLRMPMVDECVKVELTGVNTAQEDTPIFSCRVLSEGYHNVEGIISRKDIVGYTVRNADRKTWSHNGRGYILDAMVKEITDDGKYEFTLREIVDDYLRDQMSVGEIYEAGVTGQVGQRFSGVCETGRGLFLNDPQHINPKSGATVSFRYLGLTERGAYEGEIIDFSPTEGFTNAEILKNLFAGLEASTPFYDDEDEEGDDELMREPEELLMREDVEELARLFRFKALVEENLVTAFDYVHYGRLLAILADNKELAEEMSTHAALLNLTQFFATNDRVDPEELKELKPKVEGRPLLENLYRRLDIVDMMGKREAVETLESILAHPHNELEKNLVKLALSYTLVSLTCQDEPGIAESIRRRIKSLLKVNYETPTSKYYGSESQYTEFKSSTVYPAVKAGKKSVENLEEQQFELLHIIAGFLNSTGGTLYIGVNDRGYACGLPEDMDFYRKRKKVNVGDKLFSVSDSASLALMLENLVRHNFNEAVSRKVRIGLDDEAVKLGKDVITVAVEPSYEPVLLNGKLFVRTSTSTIELRDASKIEVFERERERISREHENALRIEKEKAEQEATKARLHADSAHTASPAEAKTAAKESAKATDVFAEEEAAAEQMSTSAWKTIILHSHQDKFVQPQFYLYFTSDGKLELDRTDTWRDTQPDCHLALTVPSHEAEDGWLFVAFDNGRVMKFKLSELQKVRDIQRGVMLTREDTCPVFAATTGGGGYAICFGSEKSGGVLMRRAVPLASLESSRMGGDTQPFLPGVTADQVVSWEVAEAASEDLLSDCLPGKQPRNFGVSMRARINTPEADSNINNFIERLKVNNDTK